MVAVSASFCPTQTRPSKRAAWQSVGRGKEEGCNQFHLSNCAAAASRPKSSLICGMYHVSIETTITSLPPLLILPDDEPCVLVCVSGGQ